MKKHLYLMPVLALSMATFALAGCDDNTAEEQAAMPAATEEVVVAESSMPTATEAPVAATIVASDAVAYATALGSTNGAVFVTLQNPQTASDTLTGATTDVAESVEIHQTTTDDNGVASMTPVSSIEIMPGNYIRLAPDSYHLMLMDLAGPLSEGQTFNVTMTFTNAGDISVPVTVVAAGDVQAADPMNHDGQNHQGTMPVDEAPVTEDTAPSTMDDTSVTPDTTTTDEPATMDSTTDSSDTTTAQ